MWAPLVLTGHSLRRMRTMVVVMTAILAGFQVLLAAMADWLATTHAFGQLEGMVPPAVRQLMGPSLLSMLSVSGIVALGYYHTVIEAALVALVIVIGSEPLGEIEGGFADLTLSRPVRRSALMIRTLALVLVCPAVVVSMMGLGTAAGLKWMLHPEMTRPEPSLILSLMLNLWALLMAWGGITMAVASASRRRSASASVVGVTALVAALIDYLARAWTPVRSVAWLSPFHYYSPLDIVMGAPVSLAHVATLLGLAAVGVTVAFAVFLRRDL